MNSLAASKTFLTGHLYLLIIFALIAFVGNTIAYRRGFFHLTKNEQRPFVIISLFNALVAFGIYLLAMIAIPMLLSNFANRIFEPTLWQLDQNIKKTALLQIIGIGCAISALFAYCLLLNRQEMWKMWKTYPRQGAYKTIFSDILFGFISWLIAFPFVVVIAQLCDLLLYSLLGITEYEQAVVSYLKMTLNVPWVFGVTIFIILVIAPILEEFLFRGLLQNAFTNLFGFGKGLVIASLCFAFFHFSPSQGAGNFSLIITLFSLSLYLGFIYQKRKSLFAPIALHAVFNGISMIRIFLSLNNT